MEPRRLKYLRVNDDPPEGSYDVVSRSLPLEVIPLGEWFKFCQDLARQNVWAFELMSVDFNFRKDNRSGPSFPTLDTRYRSRVIPEFIGDLQLGALQWSDMLDTVGPNTGLLMGLYLAGHIAHRDLPCGISFHTYNPHMVQRDMSSAMLATQLLLASGVELPLTNFIDMMRAALDLVEPSNEQLYFGLGNAILRFRQEFLRRAGAQSSRAKTPFRLWMDTGSLWSLLDIFQSVQTEEQLHRELDVSGIDFYDRNGILDSLDVRSVFFDRLLTPEGRILERLPLSEVRPAGNQQLSNGIIWDFVETLALQSAPNIEPVLDYFRRFKSGENVDTVIKALRRPIHRFIALLFAWIDLYAESWIGSHAESWDPAEGKFEADFEPLTRQISELLRIIALAKEEAWADEKSSIPVTGPKSIISLLRTHLVPESPLSGALRLGRAEKHRTQLALTHLLGIATRWGCLKEEGDERTGKGYKLISTRIPDRRPLKISQSALATHLGFEELPGKDYSKQLTRIIQDTPGYENMTMKDFMNLIEERPLPAHLQWLGWQFVDEFWGYKSERRLPFEALPLCLSEVPASDGGQLNMLAWARELRRSHESVMQVHSIIMPAQQSFQGQFCDIACWHRSADEIGGDYCSVRSNAAGQQRVSVFDVCGKGIAAALIVQEIHAITTLLAEQNLSTIEICRQLDERLGARVAAKAQAEPSSRWATGVSAVIDPELKTFTYTNAGHPSPLLVRKDGSFQTLDSQSRGLGIMPGARYYSNAIQLQSGDRLVIFTDGLTETPEDSLLQVVRMNIMLGAEDLTSIIVSSMTSEGKPSDDTTIIVIAVH